jgi:putative addiction module killer protein
MYSIRKYACLDGRVPFDDWIRTFKNTKDRARLLKRLDKVQLGNLGDRASIGDGVFELREHFGAGYRIYYGLQKQTVILLLCGGDKSSQTKDIKTAKQYWYDFKKGN